MELHKGVYTALITPFFNGEIDFLSLENIIEFQIEKKITGLVLCGTTAETPTLDKSEIEKLLKFSSKLINKRVPIIVGCGTNDTKSTLEYVKLAQDIGADYALIVTPYYNRPNDEGLFNHFKEIHDNTNIPIILYDIPFRTGLEMSFSLIEKLSKLTRIIAIKDSTFDLKKPLLLKNNLQTKNLKLFSGDDYTSLAFLAQGGIGSISVLSNVIPDKVLDMHNHFLNNNLEEAISLNNSLSDWREFTFLDNNPTALKYLAYKMGLIKSPELRLPNIALCESKRVLIDNFLKQNNE